MSARIALVLPDLDDGGIQVSNLRLARAFIRLGHKVEFILCRKQGVHLASVPAGATVVGLHRSSSWRAQLTAFAADPWGCLAMLQPVLLPRTPPTMLRYLPSLAMELQHRRPDLVIASSTHLNLTSILARARIRGSFRLLVTERNTYSRVAARRGMRRRWRWRYLGPLVRRLYAEADGIVAVSKGVADDLSTAIDIPRERITPIYNPVVDDCFQERASEPLDHPWFRPGSPPVLVGVGRLNDEHKNFSVLIEAMARVRECITARLVILGEGQDRRRYERQIARLGLADCVDLPGFVRNPLPYLRRASCFVLSSTHEGLPAVLIEALACGCPVVSTDCPSGPLEILDHGRFGPLVPVGDPKALSKAILETLNKPRDSETLMQRGMRFSDVEAARSYLALADLPAPLGRWAMQVPD